MTFAMTEYLPVIIAAASIVLGGFVFYSVRRRMIVSRAFRSASLKLVVQRSEKKALVKEILIISAILFAAFSLLAPQWGERTREVKKEGTDFLAVMDVSRSMDATDVKPSRLERAKTAVRLVADELKGDRAGMVLFAGSAFLQCPLTTDLGAFSQFLDSVSTSSVSSQGTDIGAALAVAEKVFEKKRTTARVLFLITDGEDHEGNVMKQVTRLKALGVSVYTAGIGKSSGEFVPGNTNQGDSFLKDRSGTLIKSSLNEDLLKNIASETGGQYINLTDSLSGVKDILAALAKEKKQDFGSRMIREPEERYYVPASILLILLLAELLVSDRRKA
jgi:Ca-activated chloride channel homolog